MPLGFATLIVLYDLRGNGLLPQLVCAAAPPGDWTQAQIDDLISTTESELYAVDATGAVQRLGPLILYTGFAEDPESWETLFDQIAEFVPA